jgi:hypothetical protein
LILRDGTTVNDSKPDFFETDFDMLAATIASALALSSSKTWVSAAKTGLTDIA